MHKRISVDPKIFHGQAGIKGTRIPVHQIIRMLANGDKIQELLEDYPSIKVENIYACLDYAASLTEEQITPIDMTESAKWKFSWMRIGGLRIGGQIYV